MNINIMNPNPLDHELGFLEPLRQLLSRCTAADQAKLASFMKASWYNLEHFGFVTYYLPNRMGYYAYGFGGLLQVANRMA